MCFYRRADIPPSLVVLADKHHWGEADPEQVPSCEEHMVGSLKMNTTLKYSTRVVQRGDRRCKKSTLIDLAYLTPLRIPLMNPVIPYVRYTACPPPPTTLSGFCVGTQIGNGRTNNRIRI
jgi:hypothetical protein